MQQTPAAPTIPLTLDQIDPFISSDGSHLRGHCHDINLHSHFQPIYSLAHQRIVGFEALVRPYLADGRPLPPLDLFGRASSLEETVFLDRLCRTLHLQNFARQPNGATWLFLNLNPLVTVHGKHYGPFFRQLLERHGIAPQRVVIEILEGQIGDENQLAEALTYYRDMGCLIAIDDFGTGHSNFDRIWRLAPHIVKLDKSVVEQAIANPHARRVLPGLVSLIHQAGSFALLEGIETEAQAMLALGADVDFVQGYFFARPALQLPAARQHPAIARLFADLQDRDRLETEASRIRLAPYTGLFFEASIRIRAGEDPQPAAAALLALPSVLRCYLLDAEGRQVNNNLLPPLDENQDPRFEPLGDPSNAIWGRRHYYQRAIREPGRIQVSKPYLSITGGSLCVTLSIAISTTEGLRVLCADIGLLDS